VQHHAADVAALTAELLPIAERHVNAASEQPHQIIMVPHGTQGTAVAAAAGAASSAAAAERLKLGDHGNELSLVGGRDLVGEAGQGQLHPLSLDVVLHELCSYSMAIAAAVPSVHMARQEFAWRNGFFLQQGATPKHVEWLRRAGCSDLLSKQA
jgi:hypothetical protein